MKKLIFCSIIIIALSDLVCAQGIILGAMKKFVKKEDKKKEEDVKKSSYISDLHKNRVKQIVFYKKHCSGWSDLSEEMLSTNFTLQDTLKAMAFDETPIEKYLEKKYPDDKDYKIFKSAGLIFSWSIDGKFASADFMELGANKKRNWNFYDIGFTHNYGRWEPEPPIWRKFVRTNLSTLTPGDHTIKLELLIGSEGSDTLRLIQEPIASGTFTLTVGSNKVDPNNKVICAPAPYAGKRDLKTEQAIMEAFKNADLGEPTKAILGSSYNEEINDGVKYRTAWTTIVYKKEGKCYTASYLFKQDYGATGYTDVELIRQYDTENIDCGCLK